jgi:CubicO group peptidase (beta-lactamase class C family)
VGRPLDYGLTVALDFEAAAELLERRGLQALLAVREGEILFERYVAPFTADTPHALYSGTKSFWGTAALAARDDGLLSLDERVGETFASWSTGRRADVTLRMLLQLTSGIGFGGLGNAVPTYEKALAVELKNDPGSTFTYGGIPLQVFGAVFARKLAARGLTPHAYLRERILDPIGCEIASWRVLRDGTNPLPTGAFLTAASWARYGLSMLSGDRTECLRGSNANPRYGLGWWLSPLPEAPDLFYASGSGGQAMYVFPSRRIVVVVFAAASSPVAHATLLRRLVAARRS